MNNQFVSSEGLPEIKPQLNYYQKLLKEIPEKCWDPEVTADDIWKLGEDEDNIRVIYECAQIIINGFSKLEETEQSEEWKDLKEKAEATKNNLKTNFPVLVGNREFIV